MATADLTKETFMLGLRIIRDVVITTLEKEEQEQVSQMLNQIEEDGFAIIESPTLKRKRSVFEGLVPVFFIE